MTTSGLAKRHRNVLDDQVPGSVGNAVVHPRLAFRSVGLRVTPRNILVLVYFSYKHFSSSASFSIILELYRIPWNSNYVQSISCLRHAEEDQLPSRRVDLRVRRHTMFEGTVERMASNRVQKGGSSRSSSSSRRPVIRVVVGIRGIEGSNGVRCVSFVQRE